MPAETPPGTVAVRTTLRPDEVLHVLPAEAEDLRAQGLLVLDPVPADTASITVTTHELPDPTTPAQPTTSAKKTRD